jgi:hypothetical protein
MIKCAVGLSGGAPVGRVCVGVCLTDEPGRIDYIPLAGGRFESVIEIRTWSRREYLQQGVTMKQEPQ